MTSKNTKGSFKALVSRLISDESGSHMIEYSLVVGLIAILCMVAIKEFGATLAQKWNEVTDIL